MRKEMSRERFIERFGAEPEFFLEVPGRTELGGNHTDHQNGLVIAAPVDLKMRAWVRKREDRSVRVCSEGYGSFGIFVVIQINVAMHCTFVGDLGIAVYCSNSRTTSQVK